AWEPEGVEVDRADVLDDHRRAGVVLGYAESNVLQLQSLDIAGVEAPGRQRPHIDPGGTHFASPWVDHASTGELQAHIAQADAPDRGLGPALERGRRQVHAGRRQTVDPHAAGRVARLDRKVQRR